MKKLTFIIALFVFTLNLFSQEGNYRDSIDVISYTISITEINYADKSIKANTKLVLKPQFTELNSITLDLLALNVDSVFISGKKQSFSCENNLIKVSLRQKLTKETEVTVYYQGKPQADASWGGFYFKENYVFNYGVGMASTPPNFGRAWYPCIDNFTDCLVLK